MEFCKSRFIGLWQVVVLLCLLQAIKVEAQSPNATYRLVNNKNFVVVKNYYLLNLLQAIPEAASFVKKDSLLQRMAIAKFDSLQWVITNNDKDIAAMLRAFMFSDAEIKAVSVRFAQLYQSTNLLGKIVQQHLIPSGCYYSYQNLAPVELLIKAWEQDANGVNFCLSVYAAGKKPNYPLIDSASIISYTKTGQVSPYYASTLHNISYLIAQQFSDNRPPFFSIPLAAAVDFIDFNERDQAADDEPMENSINRLAAEKAKTVDWKKFPYTVILVPGAGPDDPAMPLSAEGMIRCRLAAIEYKKGLAPFIVVSGGKVHPYKTKYNEATEMQKYLVNKLDIPASAVIQDPHARHTTTNMRNTVRIMFRYGMPWNKPGITCTTRGQSNMIEKTLIARCQKELNTIPYAVGKRLSETLVEFIPLYASLQINPLEPIDP
jgi:hypothetical protein